MALASTQICPKAAQEHSRKPAVQEDNGTTVVIKNISYRVVEKDITRLFDDVGLEGRYHYAYVPCRRTYQRTTNFGYAFARFHELTDAELCVERLHGLQGSACGRSAKVLDVSVAERQDCPVRVRSRVAARAQAECVEGASDVGSAETSAPEPATQAASSEASWQDGPGEVGPASALSADWEAFAALYQEYDVPQLQRAAVKTFPVLLQALPAEAGLVHTMHRLLDAGFGGAFTLIESVSGSAPGQPPRAAVHFKSSEDAAWCGAVLGVSL